MINDTSDHQLISEVSQYFQRSVAQRYLGKVIVIIVLVLTFVAVQKGQRCHEGTGGG